MGVPPVQREEAQKLSTPAIAHKRLQCVPQEKRDFLLNRNEQSPQKMWNDEWDVAHWLLRWIWSTEDKNIRIADSKFIARLTKSCPDPSPRAPIEEPSTEACGLEFLRVLESACDLYSPLKDIIVQLNLSQAWRG